METGRPAHLREDREGLLRVARDSARVPVAEGRLRHDAERAEVELVSDRVEGPFSGVLRMRRWNSWRAGGITCRSATRCGRATWGRTRRDAGWGGGGAVVRARSRGEPAEATEAENTWPALRARRRRWAELLRLVFRVEVGRRKWVFAGD